MLSLSSAFLCCTLLTRQICTTECQQAADRVEEELAGVISMERNTGVTIAASMTALCLGSGLTVQVRRASKMSSVDDDGAFCCERQVCKDILVLFHVAIRTALIFFRMCATFSPKQRQNLLHSSE